MTITVNVSDWNERSVAIPLMQLIQWKAAMKLEELGMQHSRGSVTAHVRRTLSAPRSFTRAELIAYIGSVITDVQGQLS